MKNSDKKEIGIRITFTKKSLAIMLASLIVFLGCLYLLITITVNHRNPINGLKYIPSDMVKIPIDVKDRLSEKDATDKLEKAGFGVESVYYLRVEDSELPVGTAYIDSLGNNKKVIQFYAQKRSIYNNLPNTKYGYDVKGLPEYAPKGSKIILSVSTDDISKVDDMHEPDSE